MTAGSTTVVRGVVRRWIKPLVHRSLKRPLVERGLIALHRSMPPIAGRVTAKLLPQPESYGPDETREATRRGTTYLFRPAQYSQWHHYFDLPDPVLDLLVAVSTPDAWTVDVGANVGVYSLAVARAIRGGGRVLAIEPHPTTFSVLERHLRVNGADNVVALNCAAGEEPGSLVLFEAESGDSGKSTLVAHDRVVPRGEVRVRRLDELIAEVATEGGVSRVGAIKIDVEGFEPEVILGARETLPRDRPFVFFEYTPRWSASRPRTLQAASSSLETLGYRLFVIREGEALSANRVDRLSDLPHDRQYNVVAVPPHRLDEVVLLDARRGLGPR